jgi:ubiquitin
VRQNGVRTSPKQGETLKAGEGRLRSKQAGLDDPDMYQVAAGQFKSSLRN